MLTKFLSLVFLTTVVSAILAAPVWSQDDEARSASGLPTYIGPRPGSNPNNTSTFAGSLVVQGIEQLEFTPALSVAIYANGALVDRRTVQNRGSFAFNGLPRDGISLVVESDGQEVARFQIGVLNPPPLTNRQDILITSAEIGQVHAQRKAAIALLNAYQRTEEDQRLFEKGLAAEKDKKDDNALKLFSQLTAKDPADFVAWTELGNLHFKAGKLSDADQDYTKALALKPDYVPALLNSGKLYLNQKTLDRAVAALEKAVAAAPLSADANHFLGEAYLQSKLGSKAVVYLNKAIELAPIENAEIHLRLAALYTAANLKGRAAEEYKVFLSKVPNYPERAKMEKFIAENSTK